MEKKLEKIIEIKNEYKILKNILQRKIEKKKINIQKIYDLIKEKHKEIEKEIKRCLK